MESSLQYLLGHGSVVTRGRALVLLAHCRLAAVQAPASDGTRRQDLLETVSILTTAQDWLLKAQDFVRVKHCWYLKVSVLSNRESLRLI